MLRIKEPVNTWTHFITFIAALIGLVYLIKLSYGSVSTLITMMIYGMSVTLLFGASSLYHWIHTTPKKELILKKIDHCAIYLMIAGSCTPVFYHGLYGLWKWIMLLVVWVLAGIGMVLKMRFIHLPRFIYTSFYVILGWIPTISFVQLIDTLPLGAIYLMLIGGIFYTLGAMIYATRWFNFVPNRFGFHEVFHLFIMAGAGIHFVMMIVYIIPLAKLTI